MAWRRWIAVGCVVIASGMTMVGCKDKVDRTPPPGAPKEETFQPPQIDMGTEGPSTPAKDEKKK